MERGGKGFREPRVRPKATPFGNDVPRVRQFLSKQALRQNATALVKKGAKYVIGGAAGTVGYELAKGNRQHGG